MAINADENGFLIGQRRLKEMADGITQTEDNTKQILQVLTDSFNKLQKTYEQGNAAVNNAITQQNRGGRSQDAEIATKTARTVRNTVDAAEKAVEATEQALKAVKRIRKKAIDADIDVGGSAGPSSGASSASERAEKARERDANGRFIGKDGKKQGLWSRFKGKLGFGDKSGPDIHADVGGVDPTIDAARELGSLLSPVKNIGMRVGSAGLRGLKGIWRMIGKRRDEQLPKEQTKANKEAAKADKKQNKLLQSILNAIYSQEGGGGGLLGGLMGRGGGLLSKLFKGGAKGLLKKIPFLGALLGGGLLAKDWGKLDAGGKGKGIGEIVGTAVGGILGSFFGPVGTIAGGSLGAYLGSIFGEKVGKWTDSLEKQDFAGILKNLLKSVLGIGSGNEAFIPYANAGQSKFERFKSWASDKLGISSGTTATVGDNIDYSKAPGNANSAGNVATDTKARQLGMYNALRKAGFTHEQSLAHVGQIGRENSYGDKMFSTHTDPSRDKNGNLIQNGGVMSWNGPRYKKFAAYMRERGLMDANGNMPKTQAVLDAQAAFMKKESDDPEYKKRMTHFNNNPHADPRTMAPDMQSYYGWARGQSYVRGKDGKLNVPFDWKAAEARGNGFIDSTVPLIQNQSSNLPKASVPAAKGKPQESILFPKGASRPAPIKVPAITPALTKIGASNLTKPVNTAPMDNGISQTVSDRSLAHVQSGGIGYNQYNT